MLAHRLLKYQQAWILDQIQSRIDAHFKAVSNRRGFKLGGHRNPEANIRSGLCYAHTAEVFKSLFSFYRLTKYDKRIYVEHLAEQNFIVSENNTNVINPLFFWYVFFCGHRNEILNYKTPYDFFSITHNQNNFLKFISIDWRQETTKTVSVEQFRNYFFEYIKSLVSSSQPHLNDNLNLAAFLDSRP